MAENTKIQWCDKTASPWHGCSKVATGCLHCYAERQAARNPGTLGVWGDNGTRIKSKSFIANLRKWNKQAEADGVPVKVFPSICDPFEDRPELVEWRNEMFAVADECPWVILLLLTKRPENIRRMWPRIADHPAALWDVAAHRPNVWPGTSISTQADANRNIPYLQQCRDLSPVLFVSAEPLVGPISFRWAPWCPIPADPVSGVTDELDGLRMIDWMIIGGESGPQSRPCDVTWIRPLRDQCRAAGVPVFFKQIGSLPVGGKRMTPQEWRLRDPKGGDMSEWPDDLRIREFPVVKQWAAT